MVFIDLEKILDRVNRDIMRRVLEKKRVNVTYIEAIKDMYQNITIHVKALIRTSSEFPYIIGLH